MRLYHNKDWLYQKYIEEKMSAVEIAKICEVSNRSRICKWLKKHNIKSRSLKEAQDERYKKERSPLLGRELPGKTKKKISKALRGKYTKEKNHMYGKTGMAHQRWGIKHTEAVKKTIGDASRGRKQSKESIEKRVKHLRGKKRPPFSQEWKDNISKAVKQLWTNPEYIKTMLYSRRGRPTKPEEMFNKITSDIVRYVGNGQWWRTLPNGKHKNPDFKVTGQRKVIEIFGDYWHRNDNPQELIDLYKQLGYDCLVIWEHEVYNQPSKVLKKTNKFLRFRQDMSPT